MGFKMINHSYLYDASVIHEYVEKKTNQIRLQCETIWVRKLHLYQFGPKFNYMGFNMINRSYLFDASVIHDYV